MSHPIPGTSFTVSPRGVTALAGELAALGAELAGDVQQIRGVSASLPAALEGHEGCAAGAGATAWAQLCDLMASRTSALAQLLTAAVTAYLAEDAAVARSVGPGPR